MTGRNIGDQGIIELSKLKNLTSLALSHDFISGERAKELAKFTGSTLLALVSNDISYEGAKELAKFKNINILIDNTVSAEGAEELAKLENIGTYIDNTVSLKNVKESAKPRSINPLTGNTKSAKRSARPTIDFNKYVRDDILSIQLCSTINISELVSFLQNKPDITSLNLADCNIGDEGAKELAELENITSLTLVGDSISDEGAKALAHGNFTCLTDLDLFDNNIGDKGAKALAHGNLTNLTYLDLSKNNIGDKGVKELTKLVNLIDLDLSKNNISDEGVKELAKLQNLNSLALSGNNISDKVVEKLLGQLKNLISCDLWDNDVDEEEEQRIKYAMLNYDPTIASSSNCSNGITKEPFPEGITDQLATVSDNKTVLNIGHKPSSTVQVLKQEQNSDKQPSGLNPHSAQKSKLPVIIASMLIVVGVVLGIAGAVYLEMLVGIIVGAVCCLISVIIYCYNRPSNSLENNNVQGLSGSAQNLTSR
ncbi:TomO hydrophobic C-terminal domain-containing protein [Candidatus Wolbachia massiliensis]|uniref:Uncharacterized protein n=1 Tax=Candidatus Wolbachia massiliensis TaxID=1845000 RepID=A0A7L7YLC2_9RICK|nr:hypothetical protein [Candidatus Wolbachia massiliensis]QOD38033.1 hypothetical protein ID128_04325 [Candidatus Wolbachia massiliensis]